MSCHVVTFHKCGSNWFRQLFRDTAQSNGWNIDVDRPNTSEVNRSMDLGGDQTLHLYRNSGPNAVGEEPGPVLLCIRDPKDVLVSQYWSWRNTHKNNTERIERTRERLLSLDQREGLRLLAEEDLLAFCRAVRQWIPQIEAQSVTILRYEDLLEDFFATMRRALDVSGLKLDEAEVAELKDRYDFSKYKKKRAQSVDTGSHYRKGVAGDWKNNFDPELAEIFDSQYGDLCRRLGYLPAMATQES